jgi:hypothetical protein
MTLIKELAIKHKVSVKYIRCDNAGENGSLEKYAPYKARASNLNIWVQEHPNSMNERKGLWTEAARTATGLENILVSTMKQIASYNAFFQKDLRGLRNMRTFGKITIVNNHKTKKMRGKLDDQGRPCLLLGRAENHHRGVYRFLNLETEKVIRSQDALWLNQQYGAWKGIPKQTITNIDDDDDDDEPFIDAARGKTRDIEAGREAETTVRRIEIVDNDDNPVRPKLARAM